MYQRILVAIDESATSELALKEAALLAKEHNATLRLAHVIDDTVAYTVALTPHELVQRQADFHRVDTTVRASRDQLWQGDGKPTKVSEQPCGILE